MNNEQNTQAGAAAPVAAQAGASASTVLTDERIDDIARPWCGLGGVENQYAFARAIAHEVAAQAGHDDDADVADLEVRDALGEHYDSEVGEAVSVLRVMAAWKAEAELGEKYKQMAFGAAQAGQVAVPEFDLYMRSRIADLLHLLQFATISTPSHGDADQAKLVMADLRRNLAKTAPSAAKESK